MNKCSLIHPFAAPALVPTFTKTLALYPVVILKNNFRAIHNSPSKCFPDQSCRFCGQFHLPSNSAHSSMCPFQNLIISHTPIATHQSILHVRAPSSRSHTHTHNLGRYSINAVCIKAATRQLGKQCLTHATFDADFSTSLRTIRFLYIRQRVGNNPREDLVCGFFGEIPLYCFACVRYRAI